MSKTFTAPFAQTLRTATAVCTLAGTFVDDNPTNTVLLATAGAEGSLVTEISVMPRATNTAANVLLFLSKDGGTTKRLINSRLIPATTVSNTVATPVTAFDYTELAPLRLEALDKLYVSTAVALVAGFVFKAEFTDY